MTRGVPSGTTDSRPSRTMGTRTAQGL
jgi:hypothetical protein